MASYVARQPVFNSQLKIYGYELLYRGSSPSHSFDDTDGDTATSETIANSFHEMGIERVTNGKRAFINFSERLLLDDVASILPRQILVIELLENILPTPEVLAHCKALRSKGYTIALDDFRIEADYLPLIAIADIIKIDFLSTKRETIASFARTLAEKPARLLAEKVETYDDFEFAKSLGFVLFQGYFFSKPVIVGRSATLSPLRANCLQLIRLSFEPDADFTTISAILQQDVALSYRLLRVVNSAFFGMRYTVKNIKQALAILGMDEVKKWVTLISMVEIKENKPDELVSMSLIRARMLELLAPMIGQARAAGELFMLGLMSLMDAIMDLPFDEIAKLTRISEDLFHAIATREGKYGDLLAAVIAYERSEWDRAFALAEKHGVKRKTLSDLYLKAVTWANGFVD